MNGCIGNCCQSISIDGITHGDLAKAYTAWTKGEATFESSIGTLPIVDEIHLVYPMLKVKGVNERGKEVYECKLFDKVTGLCTIYNIRPQMCRNYPNAPRCPVPNCKYEGSPLDDSK